MKSIADLTAMGFDGFDGAAAPTATGLGGYEGAADPRAIDLGVPIALNIERNGNTTIMNDHYSCRSSSTATSTSIPIDSSNIGFQLLKKHGWKEGTGLGIAEQGRLEPVEGHIKKNKRGLGADKGKMASERAKSEKDGNEDKMPLKKKTKVVTKKMKKILEYEKRLQEKELLMEFYREFWPDNV